MQGAGEFAHIRDQIAILTARARRLREAAVNGTAPRRSSIAAVAVTDRLRQALAQDRVPASVQAVSSVRKSHSTPHAPARATGSRDPDAARVRGIEEH